MSHGEVAARMMRTMKADLNPTTVETYRKNVALVSIGYIYHAGAGLNGIYTTEGRRPEAV